MSDLLLALRTFVRIADGLSFSRIAALSGASHTSVARRLDQLEAHFGARLVNRTTRRLTLTPEGLQLIDHARAVTEAMDHAEAEFGGGVSVRGIVRVGVTTALGLFYVDRLGDLTARHPDLRLEFALADWQAGLAESGMDLALRVGAPVPEAASIIPLGKIARVLVAAPGYLAGHGTPATAAALTDHECIAYGYGPTPTVWEINDVRFRVSGRFRANSSEAVYRAVVSGLGIGLLPEIQVRSALATGLVHLVLPDVMITPLHLSIEHRYAGTVMPARVRIVRDYLTDTFPNADL